LSVILVVVVVVVVVVVFVTCVLCVLTHYTTGEKEDFLSKIEKVLYTLRLTRFVFLRFLFFSTLTL